MNRPYPTITVYQPWATLVYEGFKPLEFRRRAAPRSLWGQRVAIHAAARAVMPAEVWDLIVKLQEPETACTTGLVRIPEAVALLERVLAAPGSLPLGSVLCRATMGPSIRDDDLMQRLGVVRKVNDSDRDEHSNWGWPLDDIEPLRPFVPATGQRGWWYCSLPVMKDRGGQKP